VQQLVGEGMALVTRAHCPRVAVRVLFRLVAMFRAAAHAWPLLCVRVRMYCIFQAHATYLTAPGVTHTVHGFGIRGVGPCLRPRVGCPAAPAAGRQPAPARSIFFGRVQRQLELPAITSHSVLTGAPMMHGGVVRWVLKTEGALGASDQEL